MPITRRRRANPPEQPENNNNNNNHAVEQQAEQNTEAASVEQPTTSSDEAEVVNQAAPEASPVVTPPPVLPPVVPPMPTNGAEQQGYTPTIESGRRTSRGELFRRPPQPPQAQQQQPAPAASQAETPLQAPTHEISLPLGNLLHLAYNPGYTGSDEARSTLLTQLANESKAGGRARCWNCGSIAIAYDRWSTRSKTFGEVGIAFCEICGVWSVL